MSLAKLAEPVKIYPQLLKNVRVSDKKTARENPQVIKAVDAVAEALGDDGRILVRESGTEPVIRVMVEAGMIHRLLKIYKSLFINALYIINIRNIYHSFRILEITFYLHLKRLQKINNTIYLPILHFKYQCFGEYQASF